MPRYRVDRAAVTRARTLIDDGEFDDATDWSDAAPDADAQNAYLDRHGYDGFAAWHLAEDPDAGEETKRRYAFPYGALPSAGSHRERAWMPMRARQPPSTANAA